MLALVNICFFFQAEDGIRDYKVTGVQTCALPILGLGARILSFGEHPYTWNDNAGTLTKWNVDRTTLDRKSVV